MGAVKIPVILPADSEGSLKTLLEYHLIAAEDAGAASEVEEVKRLLNSLP